jgi:long-chain acyl-CoA synthetase
VHARPPAEPGDELAADLASFCRQRLASYKVPRRWEFRNDLPRTEAGKLYKRKIRDEYVAATEETRP